MMQMSQNIAIASNKCEAYANAVEYATNAIKIDEKAEKAYLQRSTAYLKLKQFDNALADAKALVMLKPNEKSFRDHHEMIKKAKKDA